MNTVSLASESLLFGQVVNWQTSSIVLLGGLLTALFAVWLCFRHIPNNSVGVVEKLWSPKGSVPEGHIIALAGEAGFQAELLRGGVHFGYWRWQYSIHRAPLVTISQGKLGYVYARDGQPLQASQSLGRDLPCNSYQDARAFLVSPGVAPTTSDHASTPLQIGQRGRQRSILREGVYAINPALFVVLTEERVYGLRAIQSPQEIKTIELYRAELQEIGGFSPIVVGAPMDVDTSTSPDQPASVDSVGIVTVHDGPALPPDEIIAPMVGEREGSEQFHNHYQDPEAFLCAGGRRGRQYQVLTPTAPTSSTAGSQRLK